MGSPITTSMRPPRGNHVCFGRVAALPRMAMGTTGTPDWIARRNPPFLKGSRFVPSPRVPSGKITIDLPPFTIRAAASMLRLAAAGLFRSMNTKPAIHIDHPRIGMRRSSTFESMRTSQGIAMNRAMMSKIDSCEDMNTCGRDQSICGDPTRTISMPQPHIAIRDQMRAYRRYSRPDGLSGQVRMPRVAQTIVHPMAQAHFMAPTTRNGFSDPGFRRIIEMVSWPRNLAAVAALLLAPAPVAAAEVRVAVVATPDAPEVVRLRAENAVATHRSVESAGVRAVAAGAPRRALADVARRMEADLLLVVDARSTRLWDAHRGRFLGTTLGPDATRTAMRGLLAEGLSAAASGRALPGWLSVAVAGAAAALFATFVIVRVSEPEPEGGLTLRVQSP